jgi:NAD(P)-dependent dehydrogenase (short-subunit alcohol dehydrogenase family)
VAYNVSKAGVIHLTHSLAAEWAPRGVRVNCISPGYTRTQLVDDLTKTPEGQRMVPEWMHRTPTGHFVEVTDLQGAAVFMASAASDMLTGHDLIVDGGYCVW